MMLKIIGAILVCGSSALLGLYWASRETFRADDLNEWKKALLILKSEIAFSSAPLPEAMEHIAERTVKPVSPIFHTFAESLTMKTKESVGRLWREAIARWEKQSFLAPEDWECLRAFGANLGYLDKAMQLNTIEMTLSYIDAKITFLSQHSETNQKMYRSLGVLGGLLIAVIFF
ncbi:MAG: stage III sporulation protein AB [Clostridiales bacterium]|jgi:stage III sporulation protein AB|nr:stage III sporulation protein AB [Clostridiales bacterium]